MPSSITHPVGEAPWHESCKSVTACVQLRWHAGGAHDHTKQRLIVVNESVSVPALRVEGSTSVDLLLFRRSRPEVGLGIVAVSLEVPSSSVFQAHLEDVRR